MWFIFRKYGNIASWHGHTTVYPKKYAHGFCFAVLCCGYTLTDFPISIKLTSLALWQSNDCPSASKANLMNMDNTSCEFIMNDCITTRKQSTTKPCAYFLGYTVSAFVDLYEMNLSIVDGIDTKSKWLKVLYTQKYVWLLIDDIVDIRYCLFFICLLTHMYYDIYTKILYIKVKW